MSRMKEEHTFVLKNVKINEKWNSTSCETIFFMVFGAMSYKDSTKNITTIISNMHILIINRRWHQCPHSMEGFVRL